MKKSLIAVIVMSSMASGYRRAGEALDQGENKLEVDEDQLAILKDDKRLTVTVKGDVKASTATSSNKKTSPSLDDTAIDLSGAPELLVPFITIIHEVAKEGDLTKAPKCDDLAFTAEGVDKQVKPSAAQRDEAWAWYQENIVKVAQ